MGKQTADRMDEIDEALRKILPRKRYRHSQGVRFTSAALAMAHGADIAKAELAGLLHDCAKSMTDKELYRTCRKNNIALSESEERNPALIHAKAGAFFSRERYKIDDEEVISAIRYHTTGRAGMTDLEKIVFTADYIEPMRFKSVHLPEIRKTAFSDLDECVYMILDDTLNYLANSTKDIDKTTAEAYNFYKEIHDRKNSHSEDVS
ncbi:MAG: bis(5'-nucleosyl)-tetraphosphatase (symmetrical) YqeK [Lachnospiraceae bacterium]|nr:bis(5'-nucleosyl)-tetraphosphatase (symmetrical) YqeK [Lachnospiraceae bacterium]